MKRLLLCLCAALCLCACKQTKTEADGKTNETEQQETLSDGSEYEKNGKYCIYREPLTIDSEDGKYHVYISMTPDFTMPTVKNESFDRIYCDNKASLLITTATDTIFSSSFNKDSFKDYVDANISQRAIFNRLTCRGFTQGAIKLEAEISVPHSDEECYVTIMVDDHGGMTMKRYESEAVPEEIAGA